MPIDAKLFRRAKRGNIAAAVTVMSDCYPQVHRIAFALSGIEDIGRGVVNFVMRRGIRQLPKWSDESDPPRWCRHHTLLTTRRAIRHKPALASDTLLSKDDDADFIAFVRAVRSLPMQQREAFILTHGEDWGIRSLAIAMDCSQEAAQNHLRAASRVLSELSGSKFDSFTRKLHERYQSLVPSETIFIPTISRDVKRYLWPRKIWSWIRFVLIIAIVATIVLFIWKIYPKLEY